MKVAKVGDREGGEGLAAQDENLIAETERSMRRQVKVTDRSVGRYQRERTVSLEVAGENRRNDEKSDGKNRESDP